MKRKAWLFAALLIGLSGCGNDDATNRPRDGELGKPSLDASVPVAPTDGSTSTKAKAVVYSLLVRQPEGSRTYLFAGASLPTDTIDSARGRELPDGNYYHTDDAIFFGNFETGTLQRYEVNPDFSIALVGEFSLASYGVQYLNEEPVFFSPTSAYYVDSINAQVIHFDPTEMKILGDAKAPELLRDGYAGMFASPKRMGDTFIGSVRYTNEEGSKVPNDSTLAIVSDDPVHPLRVVRDTSAASANRSFVSDAGDYYALADAEGGYLKLSGLQETPSPRLLRVKAGGDNFDDSFALDLGALLDTPAVNGLWPMGDTRFLLQAWAPELDYKTIVTSEDDFSTAKGFDWLVVDAVTKEVTKVQGLERAAWSYSLMQLALDGRPYVQQFSFGADADTYYVELHRIDEDGTAPKVVDTNRGDVRMLTQVNIRSSAAKP